jgi:hypothetical protein
VIQPEGVIRLNLNFQGDKSVIAKSQCWSKKINGNEAILI